MQGRPNKNIHLTKPLSKKLNYKSDVNYKTKKIESELTKKQIAKNSVSSVNQKPSKYSRYFSPFIIIITAVVFFNTLSNGFIDNLDDNDYILHNEIIKHFDWKNLKEIFSSFYGANYHPLTMLSYTLEYKFFGLNPFTFHLTNYIFHLLNVILVYLFLNRFTGKQWVAAISSLFFAVHPMHVESVAWISERKDVLYTFFFLLSLCSYSKYLITKKKKKYAIFSFCWFLLSLLSKPAAICLPFVLVLMDFYYYNKFTWKHFTSKIPFFALALVFGIIAVFSQRSVAAIQDITPVFSIFDRVFMVSYTTVYYLLMSFIPFNLSVLHYYPVKSGGFLPYEYYFALPVLLLIIWGVLKSRTFKKELIFGLLFYLVTIVLVLQILPFGGAIVSERYSYIPYIGIFFIFGQFFSYVKEDKFSFSNKIKSITFFIFVTFSVLYCVLTYERNKVWKNGEILFTDVIEKYPEQGYGWFVRGNSKNEKKNYKAALIDFDKAVKLGCNDVDLFMNRGIVKANMGNYSNAITDFNVAIRLKPAYSLAICNRGTAYDKIGKSDSAIADYTKAIELNQNYTDAYFYRGIVYDKIEKYESAITDYSKVIELNPNYDIPYFSRGNNYFKIGKFNNAIADYNKTIELNRENMDALFNRGYAKLYSNDKKGACNDWLSAQQNGYPQAASALQMYCK
ncbi:MAG: tetratricopeptide repeat protein [Bacteroidetes bacterium]|nr:tetratricopeptide repeat protein [Bacteroidota bacterium]